MSIKQFGLFDSKETENYICHKEIYILADGNVRTKPRNTSEGSSEATQREILDISNDGKSCSLCRVKFDKLEEQRAHFKLDWHKYNVKQMLMQKDSVKEEVFEEIISGDVSSISGSDSESDSDEGAQSRKNLESNPLMTLSLLQSDIKENQENFRMEISNPKVYFGNNLGNYMSVYREVLFPSKDFIKTVEEVACKIENLPKEKVWSILMTGGGHFAGAVFSENTVVVRKTFHRYTVRAKRGTAQGMRDSKQGGHQPKSAGASLRRYNEAALVQDIQNLLESWSEHIERCDKIFIRVPNNYKGIFFEGKKPPFKKDDARIRNIPFATRRATCKELEKVHRKLSTVEVHAENHFQDVCNKKSKKGASRRETKTETNLIHESESESLKKDLETQAEKINEDDEEEYETSKKIVKKKRKDQFSQKLPKNTDRDNLTKQTENKERQVLPNICMELYEVISSGNVEETKRVLEEIRKHDQKDDQKNDPNNFSSESDGIESKMEEMMKNDCITRGIEQSFDDWCVNMVDILNQTFQDYSDETVLHLASRLNQTDTLRILLEAGADPTIKDCRGRVPFNVAKDKETRIEFRRFMASYPTKFDYKKAQIPSPLTTEMEEEKNRKLAEKKKAQAKARKQRLKDKKADEKQKEQEKLKREQEERERDWFKNLTDREKRAVAAERRLGNICFNCSRSLQDLVPFERLSNKYCSTECVKKHRQMMETVKQ